MLLHTKHISQKDLYEIRAKLQVTYKEKDNIGLQTRNARKAQKMTQTLLAEKIGKERSFI